MILRPSPGHVRAVMRAAGKVRSRPRPASAITPPVRSYSVYSTVSHTTSIRGASRRGFHSATASATRTARSGSALTALLKRVLSTATRAVRIAPHRLSSPRALFSVLQSARAYKVQSPLLRGAIDAFRSSAQNTSRNSTANAYAQFTRGSVSFARGTLSGLGARPAAGQLGLSTVRGGVGLQTARKFSSGGARVFDNLIVNAPLALRLMGDEVEDKAKLAKRQSAVSTRRSLTASAGARRTGATFGAANLPRNALLFATRETAPEKSGASSSKSASAPESETAEFDLYFQFPQLILPSPAAAAAACVVTIRLIDPLYDALGGRPPTEPTNAAHPRLFDQAFLLDAQTALEYEHRRYLRAKAVLRVLWDAGLAEEVDLADDAVWTVRVRGMAPDEVRDRVRRGVGFAFDAWCRFDTVGQEDGEDGQSVGLDLSIASVSSASESFAQLLSTPQLSSLEPTLEDASVADVDVISLPDSGALSSSSASSSLFDSRTSM
ncbi:hypothetical protein EX895_002220 [Sporisorium graminicola]|uniref:Uncharacterized protein n=1 Tax=Sporisorium graminicola TaxID=280036 RepID=A0A4V6EUB5_9BASI|nr:hypothetical protein EX895_002220 [Sporisorium graminicola]TKY88979.1 hypothetical protein EX895_002220 [Sporisorium graminicola]